MSNCCSTKSDITNNTNKRHKINCPKCFELSNSVSMVTVLQHLSFPFNLDVSNKEFFYCANPACDNSYFSESDISYSTSQIREKAELQQGWLCYCFDISKKQYQHALDIGTASKIKDFVITQTKSHQCACEARNPSGQCCLADFKKMEQST